MTRTVFYHINKPDEHHTLSLFYHIKKTVEHHTLSLFYHIKTLLEFMARTVFYHIENQSINQSLFLSLTFNSPSVIVESFRNELLSMFFLTSDSLRIPFTRHTNCYMITQSFSQTQLTLFVQLTDATR
jgi:hypothetical protein